MKKHEIPSLSLIEHQCLAQTNRIVNQQIEEGNRESAGERVDHFIKTSKKESKEVYSNLLCMAASSNQMEAVKLYMEKGADFNYRDHSGNTPLWHAKKYGKMTEYLKEKGARDCGYWGDNPSSSLQNYSHTDREEQKQRKDKKACRLM